MSDKSSDAFRTISEVAEDLDLPQHVLRFWETRFTQIRPMKRGGGRRYYRPDDVDLLKGVRYLLYVKGFTIKGVQRILKESGNRSVMSIGAGDVSVLDTMPVNRTAYQEPEDPEDAAAAELARAIPDETENAPVAERRGGLSALLRRDRPLSSEAPIGLSKESASTLQDVLIELLECKRLLDQSR